MTNESMIEDAEMPTLRIKRPHNKVRSGCTTCKRARVKCDERRPRCTRCHRKKIECCYFDRPRTSLSPPGLPAVNTHTSESPPNPLVQDALCTTTLRDVGGIRDTELAKHYLTHTVHTFAEGGLCEDLWRTFIPAVALTCPIVHQGMLTLAAMCLHHDLSPDHSGESCLDYLEVAEAHGKTFVKESRQKLQDFQEGLNTQDQDSILACSRLLSVLAFAFLRTHRQNGTTLADPAAWTWLHLLRGVKTSYLAVIDAGRPVDDLFMKDMTPQIYDHQLAPRIGVGCNNPCFLYVQRSWRWFFGALRSTLHTDWNCLGDQMVETMGAAIDLLYQVTEQIFSQQLQSLLRTICSWPADIPRGFVDMLVVGSPPALAVYAHWLMLMILVEDLWWVGDMGRAGIRDIIAMCSDADRDVHSLLIWPQQMLDVIRGSADTVP